MSVGAAARNHVGLSSDRAVLVDKSPTSTQDEYTVKENPWALCLDEGASEPTAPNSGMTLVDFGSHESCERMFQLSDEEMVRARAFVPLAPQRRTISTVHSGVRVDLLDVAEEACV